MRSTTSREYNGEIKKDKKKLTTTLKPQINLKRLNDMTHTIIKQHRDSKNEPQQPKNEITMLRPPIRIKRESADKPKCAGYRVA